MVTFMIPEARMYNAILEPTPRQLRGPEGAPDDRPRWVSLGQPMSVLLTPERVRDDKDLLNFLEAESKQHQYYLVHLACSFRPVEEEPFIYAWLAIQLARSDRLDGPEPIAWSLEPQRLEDTMEYTDTVSLEAELKLKIGGSRERKTTRRKAHVLALDERRSNPSWEFYDTDGIKIRGLYRLEMVVQSPKHAAARGTITLTATVKRKRFGLIPYRARFEDAPSLTFDLTS